MQAARLTSKFMSVACGLLMSLGASAAQYSWTATSGLLPSEADPTVFLQDTSPSSDARLVDGALLLSTSDYAEMLYFEQRADALAVPANLVITANLQVGQGTTLPNNLGADSPRSHVAIGAITNASTGFVLFLDQDRLFLLTGPDNLGASVVVDTNSSFHNYTIEVDGLASGSNVVVRQDGVTVLTGETFSGGILAGQSPRIFWGEQTFASFGQSEWQSFGHNAALVPEPGAAAMFMIGLVAVAFVRRTSGV